MNTMNSSCKVTADKEIIMVYFIVGCLLSLIGILLNLCSCLLFCRAKSLYNTPYSIFIIALSLADIVKLFSEYIVHLLFFYIQHPYFVCSITWFLTMTSENTSYAFLCALGIERNLKVWITDRRCLITRRRACIIMFIIVILVCIYNHPFLFVPSNVFYCFFRFFNQTYLFQCNEAYFSSYGLTFSLTNLLFIENLGLNNVILPFIIILTNIILIIGLRRRSHQRCHRFRSRKTDDWRERSVILYMLLSSLSFLFLTAPVGVLFVWESYRGQRFPTDNLAIIFDLMEIFHHCSHFPILLMTSSIIRHKTYQIIFEPRVSRNSIYKHSSSQREINFQRTNRIITNNSTTS